MELKDTIELMIHDEYKKRFVAEYVQLSIRIRKLKSVLNDYSEDKFDCPYDLLHEQYIFMSQYKRILETRAELECITLPYEV